MVEPTLTKSGIALLVKGLSGSEIQFTKLQIGNGQKLNTDLTTLTTLINPLLDIDISSITRSENNVVLNGNDYTNSDITKDTTWNELGVYATDPDNGSEILFAVFNSSDDIELIPSSSSGISVENKISAMLLISSDVSVSAVIKSIQYVTKEEFEAHTSETNPHGTTKSDVGLENVENLAISEQVPEFATGQTLTNISVGDTIENIVSKLWSTINALKTLQKSVTTLVTSAKTTEYKSKVTFSSNVFNIYDYEFYVKNGIACVMMTFQINIAITQDQSVYIMTLPSGIRPLTVIGVPCQTSAQGDLPSTSIRIGADGIVTMYSFGYENLAANTFYRFQATYPVE